MLNHIKEAPMYQLQRLMTENGISNCEIAEIIGRYERVPDINTAAKLAAALGCTVDDLIEKETA